MKSNVATQVGERIKSLRLQTRGGKLTQERLAERADISVSFLSMIERGERSPHVETLSQIASALDVPLEELFRERPRTPEVNLNSAPLKPLLDFVHKQRLSRREVERLLDVAVALFGA